MRKLILALSISALIPAVSIAVTDAYGEDVEFDEFEEEQTENRTVGKRMNCADIKKEMDELSALAEPDEDQIVRLEILNADYRSKCMKRAGSRATASRGRMRVTDAVALNQPLKTEEDTNVNLGGCDTPDENGCCPGETYKDLGDAGFNCCTANDEHCFPPMKPKKQALLCDDGSKADKHGCCTGETYTDLGELGFNCCLADGVTCFPPMKK